jgi:hypothetical protein
MTTTATAAIKKLVLTSLHGREIGLDSNRGLVVKAMHRGWSFSAASGAANVCTMTLQATDNEGNNVAAVINFDAWISDAVTGAGLAASGLTSELTAGTGALVGILTAAKAWRLQTDATGLCVVSLTDTGKHLTNFCASVTGHAAPVVAATLAAANYG